jgi:hypothetical protein
MLAYVFWHWPNSDLAAAAYERIQQAFHRSLAESPPPGFLSSVVYRVDGHAPWLGGAPAYADWYLVADSAALDPLNVAAVSGACEQPHAAVARAMAAGAGSLLGLRSEHPHAATARHVSWLTKPRSMSYDRFYADVAAVADAQPSSLWRRQMVLGPTPEFGLLSPSQLPLARTFQPVELTLTPIWPG